MGEWAPCTRVLDKALSREVAMMLLTGAVDDSARARLENEARVLARLEHPGIVPCTTWDASGRPRVLRHELVRGARSVRLGERARSAERLRRSSASPCRRLRSREWHRASRSHAGNCHDRPLFGEVLVTDWGIALVSEAEAPSTGPVVGTPGFMAPEQSHGHADVRKRRLRARRANGAVAASRSRRPGAPAARADVNRRDGTGPAGPRIAISRQPRSPRI